MWEAMEVKEAEDAGVRKRKRGARVGGGEEVEEEDEEDAGVEAAEGGGGAGGGGKGQLGEEEDDDDGARYEGIAEEDVAEVMRWLELEIAGTGVAAAGSVAINGNDGESCGPSISAAASTVMASVDTRAGAPPPPRVPWPWPQSPRPLLGTKDVDGAAGTEQQAGDAVDMEMDPGGEADEEEWLARLLTCCGPMLEGVL